MISATRFNSIYVTFLSSSRWLTSRRILCAVALLVLLYLAGAAQFAFAAGMATTVHNLTPSGPGTIKETETSGLCVFCHTPHNANPTRALWNRAFSGVTYTVPKQESQGHGRSTHGRFTLVSLVPRRLARNEQYPVAGHE